MTDRSNRDQGLAPHRAGVAAAVAATALAAVLTGPASAGTTRPAGFGADAITAQQVLRQRGLRTLDGRSMVLGRMQGQVIVVNFWASWCPPCRRELPRLAALDAELAPRGGHVVAISIDDDLDNVRRFVKANRLNLAIVHDGPNGLARQLDLPHVPFTMVIDRAGSVAYTTSGSDDRSLAELAATTRRLLDSAPPPAPTAAEAAR